jgi:thiosulfate/3-mercaptopyruvate sulfurtransferase
MLPIVLALALTVAPAAVGDDAAIPRPGLLAFDELEARRGAPDLRILDARPREAYDSDHIPGAVWANLPAAEKLASTPDGLRDRDAWAEWLRPLGIAPGTTVVLYDANRQLAAARAWFLLTYLGVRDVALLDGGFTLWEKEGRPTTADVPVVPPGSIEPDFRTRAVATRADVLEALRSGADQVLDARSLGEYLGSEKRARRGGHVPGACHLEWSEFVDPDGRFLPEDRLRALVAKAGLDPSKPVVAHCQSGGRASVSTFVLARLGHDVRNYYASWSDWGNAEDTPVETGENPPEARP